MDTKKEFGHYKKWLAGVCHCIYTEKIKTQVFVAKECGIASQSFNAILKERDGKRASGKLQDRISTALGYTYEELLSLGQRILDKKDPAGWTQTVTGNGNVFVGRDGNATNNRAPRNTELRKLMNLMSEYAYPAEIKLLISKYEARAEKCTRE